MYRSDAWRIGWGAGNVRENVLFPLPPPPTPLFLLLLLSQLGGGGVDEREQALPHEALRHVAGDDVTRSRVHMLESGDGKGEASASSWSGPKGGGLRQKLLFHFYFAFTVSSSSEIMETAPPVGSEDIISGQKIGLATKRGFWW